jgi:cytochrome c oxidase assembly protein subunit 11
LATQPTPAPLDRRNKRTGLIMLAFAAGMLGLGYAAVPLYDLFCRVTGFGGTTQRASDGDASLAERIAASGATRDITIRFDANVARNMPWSFRPEQPTDRIAIGSRDQAIYLARNDSPEPIVGTASFNVFPNEAGQYFSKVQCFCFTEQRLEPGQEVRMPVVYYVDPAILDDPVVGDLDSITLSYTFHRKLDGDS